MQLLILGATGGIGTILVKDAVAQGHHVTAYARSPQKIKLTHPNLKVVRGSLFDEKEMAAALRGHDAVLSAFGPVVLRKTTQRCDFGRALTCAMQEAGVMRVQVVSSAFQFPDAGVLPFLMSHTLFYYVAKDGAAMEQQFVASSLEWTMVRPPRLTNKPATNRYRVSDGHLPKGGLAISRADVAHFMLREAMEGKHIRQLVGVSN
jgi:putative NADH-flavin reductase